MINLRNICFYAIMVYGGAHKVKTTKELVQPTQIGKPAGRSASLPPSSSPKPPSILEETIRIEEDIIDLEVRAIQATQNPKNSHVLILNELIDRHANFGWAREYRRLVECGFSTIICISTTLIAVTTIARFILELRNGTYLQPKP